jgi:hypothetical protein
VPKGEKSSRVISFACVTGVPVPGSWTVYWKVALFPSANVNVAVPTFVATTLAGSNASNRAPDVC